MNYKYRLYQIYVLIIYVRKDDYEKLLLLVLAILLLTGCSVENSNKETTKSLNNQEKKVGLSDETEEKEKFTKQVYW